MKAHVWELSGKILEKFSSMDFEVRVPRFKCQLYY